MECVGTELRTAREKKSITLGQVAEATRISHTNLERLEEGRYKDLPGGVYNRAFIRAYCEYLGLESKEMLAHYEEEMTPPSDKTARAKEKGKTLQEPFIKPHPLAAWGFMLLVSVVGLYFSRHWIASVFSPYFAHPPATKITAPPVPAAAPEVRQQPSPAPPPPETPGAASQPATVSGAASMPAAATTAGNQPGSGTSSSIPQSGVAKDLPAAPVKSATAQASDRKPGKIRIEVTVLDRCWLSVNSDGNRALVRILEPGDSQILDAEERLFLVVGNAGGIRLKINGKPAKSLGKPGEVARILINEQTMKDLFEKPSN